MIVAADLDALLHRLRAAGLRIGVEESLRASYLLGQLHQADHAAWLREALRALLVKSTTQAESFDEVFSAWATELAERERPPDLALPQERIEGLARPPEPRRVPTRPSSRAWLRRHGRRLSALLLALCVVALAGRLLLWPQPHPDLPPDAGSKPQVQDLGPIVLRTPQVVRVLAPSIVVEPAPLPAGLLRGSAALLSGLSLGALLFLGLRRRRYLPPAVPAPTRPGPRQIVPELPKSPGGLRLRLLDLRSQEALVWGIGRFVSEQKTRALDVQKTVAATAAHAGMPRLRFLHARHQREVWLWIDESAARSPQGYGALLRQLAQELVLSLRQGGLPVEEALYWGQPDRLSRLLESGQVESEFAPSEVAERQDAALVVLLTDGRLLVDALASERYRDETQALLRQLAHFPQLAFCDVSRGEFGLATHLAGLELPVLTPEQVAKFLGGVPLDPPLQLPTQISGDVRLWAAACALFPYPLDDEALFWVHDQLGLQVPAAALAQLKELGRPCGERLRFSDSPGRAALLGWLRQISPADDAPPTSLRQRLQPTWLGRCLALWRQRLADEAHRRQAADATAPWLGTPAEQHLRMGQALLDLWDQPESAALALHGLGAGWLRDELSAHLSALGPLELVGHGDLCILPWHEGRLTPLTQGILRELGFGGGRPRPEVKTQRPGRLLLAWLGCAGLVVAGAATLAQGLWQLRHPYGPPQIRQEHAPQDARIEVTPISASEYRVTARSESEQLTGDVPAGSSVVVSWAEEDRDPPDGGEPPRDLGADQASPEDLSTPVDLATPRDLSTPPDLSPPPWSCPYAEYTEPKSGMVFVKVCAGDFLMGSAKNDRDAYDDEKPAYPVHLDTFWMGKYEVSNAQYRKQDTSHRSTFDGADLPVQDVSWTEARAYCRSVGGDLPTEAEWEYAARGPTGRKYPWGKAEPEAGRATFGRAWEGGPQKISENPRGRGPFGTLNQAGNVWEWVTDCYQADRYAKRKAQSDKTVPPSPLVNPVDDRPGCDGRVLRGGSFNFGPWNLRAAGRLRNLPGNRSRDIGFRCVRGSVRQP